MVLDVKIMQYPMPKLSQRTLQITILHDHRYKFRDNDFIIYMFSVIRSLLPIVILVFLQVTVYSPLSIVKKQCVNIWVPTSRREGLNSLICSTEKHQVEKINKLKSPFLQQRVVSIDE